MNRFPPSQFSEQIQVERLLTAPPLVCNFSATIAPVERSRRPKNCSTLSAGSAQSADSIVESLSSIEPNKPIAAWFALRIVPPLSINSAGQAALSSRKNVSDLTRNVVVTVDCLYLP